MESITLEKIVKSVKEKIILAVHKLEEGEVAEAEKLFDAVAHMVYKYSRLIEDLKKEEIL